MTHWNKGHNKGHKKEKNEKNTQRKSAEVKDNWVFLKAETPQKAGEQIDKTVKWSLMIIQKVFESKTALLEPIHHQGFSV